MDLWRLFVSASCFQLFSGEFLRGFCCSLMAHVSCGATRMAPRRSEAMLSNEVHGFWINIVCNAKGMVHHYTRDDISKCPTAKAVSYIKNDQLRPISALMQPLIEYPSKRKTLTHFPSHSTKQKRTYSIVFP